MDTTFTGMKSLRDWYTPYTFIFRKRTIRIVFREFLNDFKYAKGNTNKSRPSHTKNSKYNF